MLMVQIETKDGIENIDSISNVAGIDVLFVGPSDLAHSYGTVDAGEVERAIERVAQVGRAKGIATGIHHSSLPYITKLVGQGMRFFSVNTEVGAIISSFSDMTEAVRACGKSREG